MDLTQIRYFLALARTLNFTRAADACNVTQPALTKSIQRLEEELGGPLLLRERMHTQLTPLGEAMLPLLAQTFEAAEAAKSGAARFREQDVARLRLGLGTWIDPAVVTPLIRELIQRFPTLELTLRHGGTKSLNEWMLASEIDVSLTADAENLTERANRWPVFSEPIVVLMRDDHPLAEPDGVPVARLEEHPLVGRMSGANAQRGSELALEGKARAAAPIRHHAATEEQVHAIVQAGVGLALSTRRHRLPAGIVSRTIEPKAQLEVVVAAVAGRPVSRAADAFLRLARARNWDG